MLLIVIIKKRTIRKNNTILLQHTIGFMCMTEKMIARLHFHHAILQRQITPMFTVRFI